MSKTDIKTRENISLAGYTTFKVGGPARYFCIVKTVEEIKNALTFAQEKNVDYFILSGGSNLIVSDEGYSGLVVKIEFENLEFDNTKIKVGSGFNLNKLVDIANAKGLKGLEWAGGLPGTVGGAVRGNAGAFQGEIKDVVSNVKSLVFEKQSQQADIKKSKIKNQKSILHFKIQNRNNQQCQFGYRTGVFKHNKEIILEVELIMQPGNPAELHKIASEHRQYRKEKHPIEFGCVGSIFKNIPITNALPWEPLQGRPL